MLIHTALTIARADQDRLARYIRRRDRFLDCIDCIDWTALSDSSAFEASMLDDLLDEELAESASYIDWLEQLAVEGIEDTTHLLRFDPHERPWRTTPAPALTLAPVRASIAS